jgi:hypothetical protein
VAAEPESFYLCQTWGGRAPVPVTAGGRPWGGGAWCSWQARLVEGRGGRTFDLLPARATACTGHGREGARASCYLCSASLALSRPTGEEEARGAGGRVPKEEEEEDGVNEWRRERGG